MGKMNRFRKWLIEALGGYTCPDWIGAGTVQGGQAGNRNVSFSFAG